MLKDLEMHVPRSWIKLRETIMKARFIQPQKNVNTNNTIFADRKMVGVTEARQLPRRASCAPINTDLLKSSLLAPTQRTSDLGLCHPQ
jgi:hypothetical protein